MNKNIKNMTTGDVYSFKEGDGVLIKINRYDFKPGFPSQTYNGGPLFDTVPVGWITLVGKIIKYE